MTSQSTRYDLRFKQEIISLEKAKTLLINKLGRIKKEGFTTFSAINGCVYSSGRKINNREISNGTMIPRVKKEQVASIISIAEKINNIKETIDREYFFLVVNTNSCFLQYNQEENFVLGYYEKDNFIFAYDDQALKKDETLKNVIEIPGDAWQIFQKNDSVILRKEEEVQPITYVLQNSNYHYITEVLAQWKDKIAYDFDIKPTDEQAFLLFLVSVNYDTLEDFISRITNEDKRTAFNKIKENFYFIYTNFDESVLNGDKNLRLEFKEDLDEETKNFLKFKKDLPEKWKKFFGAMMRYYHSNKNKNIDFMRELAKTKILIPLTTICVKFDIRYYTLIKN